MFEGRRSEAAWAWFAPRTSDCAPLDRRAYPSAEFLGQPIAWPEWACRAPDGGIHIDARRASIDIRLAKEPKAKLEFTWTCNFGARLVTRRWLSLVEDLVDEVAEVFTGAVFRGENKIEAWRSLHSPLAPPLLSSDGQVKTCPICGDVYSMLKGRTFFANPAVLSKPLIVNRSGIFIRRDIFEQRAIPTPVGAFSPSWVWLEDAGG